MLVRSLYLVEMELSGKIGDDIDRIRGRACTTVRKYKSSKE